MIFKIIGDSDCPLVEVDLAATRTIKVERGAMAYMQEVELEGKMNSSKSGLGGFLSAVGRSLTSGESFFITTAKAKGPKARIGIAPSIPGKIQPLKIDDQNQYFLNTGSFLAADETVEYEMISQKFTKAIFSGTGGFFIMKTRGEGDLLVNAFGDLYELEVTADSPISIDNMHVVAWQTSLDYNLEIASGIFGFTTGEGLVNTFRGNGKVLIQTRNIESLANAVRKFIPTQSSSN